MKKIITDRTKLIDASGIRKVFALAAELENPINFSIGQPDFDVPEALKEEAQYFLECVENNVQPFNDGEAGLQVVRMLEATDESLKNSGGNIKI